MRQFVQGVDLLQKLRQLAAAKKRLNHRGNRARIDQVVRGQLLGIAQTHALSNRARHARQTNAELFREQLAHRAHPAIAQVIDIVGKPFSHSQLDQIFDNLDKVVDAQHGKIEGNMIDHVETLIDAVASDRAELIPPRAEKVPLEQPPRGFDIGRVPRPQQAVNPRECLLFAVARVFCQSIGNNPAIVLRIDIHRGDGVDLTFPKGCEVFFL